MWYWWCGECGCCGGVLVTVLCGDSYCSFGSCGGVIVWRVELLIWMVICGSGFGWWLSVMVEVEIKKQSKS